MRMWMTEPRLLCRNHLLGEHVELHMLAGTLRRGKSLGRFLTDALVDPTSVNSRHEELTEEMQRRGYNHQSPLPHVPYAGPRVLIDPSTNLRELARRCTACALLQDGEQVGGSP